MSNIYTSREYLINNPSWHKEGSFWKATQILKMLHKNKLKPNSICEVGCGAGEILNQLSKQMPENVTYFGYEISPYAYNLCKAIDNDKITFYLRDIMDDEDAFYDLLMLIDVVEHVEDYLGFLRKIRAKAEWKIFHFPLDFSVNNILRSHTILRARKTLGHLHYFIKDTALASLQDSGYKIIDYFYTPVAIDTGVTFKSKLLKIPRRLMFLVNQDLAAKIFGYFSLMVLAK